MQKHNQPRAISLAQVESSTQVFANVQQPTAFAREERRDSVVSAREYHVRQHARPRPLDDVVAIRRESPRHGRGWEYYGQLIEPSMLMWLCVLAFLIGCITALMVEYGERTWALVQALG